MLRTDDMENLCYKQVQFRRRKWIVQNPSERVSGTRSNSTQRSEITIRTHGEMIPVLDL